MQSVSSRIWTRVTVSISYDNNDYTTGTSWDMMIHNLYKTWGQRWMDNFWRIITGYLHYLWERKKEIVNKDVWFGLVLWYIDYCRLFSAKSFLYLY